MKRAILLAFFMFGLQEFNFAQAGDRQHELDSLYKVANSAQDDTLKGKAYISLSEFYYGSSIDSMRLYSTKALDLAEKKLNRSEGKTKRMLLIIKAEALNSLGLVFSKTGEVAKGLELYKQALKIREELGDKNMIANSLNNIGIVYDEQGDAGKALDTYLRCLKLLEGIGGEDAQYGMGFIMNNIAFIYTNQGDLEKALQYFKKSLEIRKGINDAKGIAESSLNIGTVLLKQGKPDEALQHYESALKIYKTAGFKRGIAQCLTDIGRVYLKQNNTAMAMENLQQALATAKETKDKGDMSNGYLAIADIHFQRNELDAALTNGIQSLVLAREIGRPESIRGIAEVLQRIYVKKGDYRNAYEMQVLFTQMKDSILSAQNQKAAVQKEMQYLFDKKSTADSVKNAEQIKLEEVKHEQEISQQRSYTYGGIIGFILMLLVAGISYSAFRNKRKANLEIEKQKHLVEEKQKEIIDSITYAKRIQQSHFPTERYIQSSLKRLRKED